MKLLVYFIAGLLLLAGCTPNAQLITLRGDNVNPTEKGLIFESDTLTLSYSFYSERGLMKLTIYNKLAVPLFINWKNSAFIVGSNKFDYWQDVANVELATYYSYRYPLNRISGIISKDDQVGFIPPQTRVVKQQFIVQPSGNIKLSGRPVLEREPVLGNQKRFVEVNDYVYTADNSPCRFRNYLTLSTRRDFQTEFHIDTRFYAANVRLMPATQISDYRMVYVSPNDARVHNLHKSPDSFYLITKSSDKLSANH